MNPEQMRQISGVDRPPLVRNPAAFKARIQQAYPTDQRAPGSALVDVRVDEAGHVASVTPIDRPAGARAELILEQRDGSQRPVALYDHPSFQAAAVRALRDVEFSPAVRDGLPVPFTLRMTVLFDPPAGTEP
jgi:hypothetical protein